MWDRPKGATREKENIVLTSYGDPIDLVGLTPKIYIVNANDNTDVIANNVTTGLEAQPLYAFTANATTDRITKNAHGLKPENQIELSNSGGALPAGLAVSTRYYPVNIHPNTFQVSTEPSGAAIDITGTGTGTHSFKIIGHLQIDMQTTWVDVVGLFNVFFNLYESTEYTTIPHDKKEGILMDVWSPPGAWV